MAGKFEEALVKKVGEAKARELLAKRKRAKGKPHLGTALDRPLGDDESPAETVRQFVHQ